MFVTTMRNALLVLALFLTFLGPAARPARAQTFTRAQVRTLLKTRLAQANVLIARIQQEQVFLAQYPLPVVQTALTQDQSTLATVQSQISLLQQLLADLNQAFAIDRLIQNVQKKGGGQGKGGHGRKGQSNQQNGVVQQTTIANLQASLSIVQAEISSLQSQIIP